MAAPDRYEIFGIILETEWPLRTRMVRTAREPDLRFSVVVQPPRTATWVPLVEPDDPDQPIVGNFDQIEGVRVPRVGDAWFIDDDIVFHLENPEYDYHVEVALLSYLIAYWLEQRGRVTLHGSAVAGAGWSIGILGPNGSGKTSAALDLVELGMSLITDDLIAVSRSSRPAEAHPGFPEVRLWPDEAELRFGSSDGFAKAHPRYEKLRIPLDISKFAGGPAPLTGLYVTLPPEAKASSIEPIEGPDALFHLMLNSFPRVLFDVPARRAGWIGRLGDLLDVPMFSLPSATDRSWLLSHASEIAGQTSQSKRSG